MEVELLKSLVELGSAGVAIAVLLNVINKLWKAKREDEKYIRDINAMNAETNTKLAGMLENVSKILDKVPIDVKKELAADFSEIRTDVKSIRDKINGS
ncbi:MAG: hypothetical protein AAFQ92_14790 [Bacteroidota bacterium]